LAKWVADGNSHVRTWQGDPLLSEFHDAMTIRRAGQGFHDKMTGIAMTPQRMALSKINTLVPSDFL
jgi:hypothetical protein